MLTAATAASAALAVVLGAAAAKEPITGAFGLSFDAPVTAQTLGASLGDPPYPAPPANLPQELPEPVPGELSGWFKFLPSAVPDLLEAQGVTFTLLRDLSGRAVRILAEHPSPTCAEDLLWLTRSLARKYDAEDDPFGAEREGFEHSARFTHETRQIDVSCGPTLLIEYTDGAGYRRWLAERARLLENHRVRLAARAEEEARLEKERRRRLADVLTQGDRFRVLGGLGVTFGEPVTDSRLSVDEFVADQALPARLDPLPAPFGEGRYTLTLGPDRRPVRVAGEFPDPGAETFAEVAEALRLKYGQPMKDRPRHKIHKVNGDYVIARYLDGEDLLRLVFIDDEGRRAQQARELAAEQARLAEQQRLFEEETEGL